jgi:hypothetical protein
VHQKCAAGTLWQSWKKPAANLRVFADSARSLPTLSRSWQLGYLAKLLLFN